MYDNNTMAKIYFGKPMSPKVTVEKQTGSMTNLLNNSESSTNEGIKNVDRFIYNIVDDIFERKHEHNEESAAELAKDITRSKVDRRLQYWKDTIRQRRALQQKLCRATGKQPEQLLINKDYREVQTIKHMLDHVEQQEPQDYMEIVGMPRQAAIEQLGEETELKVGKLKSKWLESPVLTAHIDDKLTDIQNVLEFCPNISDLEIIGKNRWLRNPCEIVSLRTISSSSNLEMEIIEIEPPSLVPSQISQKSRTSRSSGNLIRGSPSKLAVLINGTTYRRYRPEFPPVLERVFVCNPYERSLRTIMRIENYGEGALNFKWKRDDFFAYNSTLLNTKDEVFIFDTEPFVLRTGDVREVHVLFFPREVGIIKQKWLLTTCPPIFLATPRALTLNMHGKCTAPPEYLQLLEDNMELTRGHCRKRVTLMALQKPILEPSLGLCPFARELEECEAFNQRNVGFHCERETDIVDVKKFFELIKPDFCHLNWDYSVRMLIELVCSKQNQCLRASLFEEMQTLLSKLRGRSAHLRLGDGATKLAERSRTRYIFVRGIICNSFELWQEKMWILEAQMLKLAPPEQVPEQGVQHQQLPNFKLKLSKSFRDSIYMYTYDQLCDIAEDIVSVIESTEHV